MPTSPHLLNIDKLKTDIHHKFAGLNVIDVPEAAKPVWLWKKWIPKGAITVLDGDPGLGKSTLLLDIAARVSQGRSMPPTPGQKHYDPEDVLIMSAEDDYAYTIRRRLDAAGADLERIKIIHATEDDQQIFFPANLDQFAYEIEAFAASLVVIDPFMSYLGKVDAYRDSEIRSLVLHKMKNIAAQRQCAIVLLRHLNKGGGPKAIYRGGGSIGIVGAARSGLMVGRHPDEPGKFVLASTKANLSRQPKSLAYAIEQTDSADEDSPTRIAWLGECDYSADDLCQPPEPKDKAPSAEQKAIIDFLATGTKALAEIASHMKMDVDQCRALLTRMVKKERISKLAKGKYCL